jgi:hypothetical protein
MMFGREFFLPLDLLIPNPDFGPGYAAPLTTDSSEYHANLEHNLKLIYNAARNNLKNAVKTQKHYYDRTSKSRNFKVSDSVWLYNPTRKRGRSPKLDCTWKGPYGVVAMHSPILAKIQTSLRAKPKIVHVDKLAHTLQPIRMDWIDDVVNTEIPLEDDLPFGNLPCLVEETLGVEGLHDQPVTTPAIPSTVDNEPNSSNTRHDILSSAVTPDERIIVTPNIDSSNVEQYTLSPAVTQDNELVIPKIVIDLVDDCESLLSSDDDVQQDELINNAKLLTSDMVEDALQDFDIEDTDCPDLQEEEELVENVENIMTNKSCDNSSPPTEDSSTKVTRSGKTY